MKFFGDNKNAEEASDIAVPPTAVESKDLTSPPVEKQAPHLTDDDGASIEAPSENVQMGVKKAQAITLTWTRSELIVAYAFVFLVFFVLSMEIQIQGNLGIHVTSTFSLLPLTGTTAILSGIIGGVIKLPIAKFIDLVGRAEGFGIMTGFATIGLVMMAATRNVTTYAAAQVFYWVGFNGMAYVLDVFMADTSSLQNRALVFAFSNTPYIVTTFIGPRAAQSFLNTSGWPWAFGVFAIITPFIAMPIMFILWRNQNKAKRDGLLVRERSGRTFLQSVNYYFWEFDIIGLLLISAGFALILLPFSLASYQTDKWRSALVISFFVIGGLCLFTFPFYEKYMAKKSFIPWDLLADRTVIGACSLSSLFFMSFYLWDSTFLNYLQAVHNLSVTNAGYVYNIYSIGGCFWGVILAVAIRIIGRFKYLIFAMMCLNFLGVALMIHFRQPSQGIGFVIMCQIFIAFGGGSMVIGEDMAVMAAAPQADVASMLALIGLFTSVGGAIGQAVSGAIYTNKFPAALDRALPGNATLNAALYGDLKAQLSYPLGSPERNAVIYAYADAQWYLTIAATVVLVPCFGCILVWKDFKVKELRKVKGLVA